MTTVIRKDTFSDTSALVSPFTHLLSDESVDSYDDVIRQSGWDFNTHDANPVVLLAHDSHQPPVGRLTRREVRGTKLYGRIEMAPRGTSQRIDELRILMGIDGGGPNILRAVSVGFFPLESRPRAGSTKGGVEYLRQRLCEVSLVSVPANSSALAIARSMKISRATMAQVFNNGSLISEHIAKARVAVAQQHQFASAVADVERKIKKHWRRFEQAATEGERVALLRSIRTLERSATNLTPPHLRTADQKRDLQLDALAAEQAKNDPYGVKAREADSKRRSTEYVLRMEAEHIARQKAEGTYVDPNPTSSGNSWRGIDLTPQWRNKKLY